MLRPKRDTRRKASRRRLAAAEDLSRLWIFDRRAFARVLLTAFAGVSESGIAARTGLSRATVRRLRRQQGTIQRHDLKRIVATAAADVAVEVEWALRHCYVDAEERWLLAQARVARRRMADLPSDSAIEFSLWEAHGELVSIPQEAEAVETMRRRALAALWRRADALFSASDQLAGLPTNEHRAIALYRIMAPLLLHEQSGFTERHPSELSDEEFRAFVAAGIQREKILANRATDFDRVTRAVRRRMVEGSFFERDVANTIVRIVPAMGFPGLNERDTDESPLALVPVDASKYPNDSDCEACDVTDPR